MCNVCKDPECHWGEYCYPDGKSVRLEPQDKAELKPGDTISFEEVQNENGDWVLTKLPF